MWQKNRKRTTLKLWHGVIHALSYFKDFDRFSRGHVGFKSADCFVIVCSTSALFSWFLDFVELLITASQCSKLLFETRVKSNCVLKDAKKEDEDRICKVERILQTLTVESLFSTKSQPVGKRLFFI